MKAVIFDLDGVLVSTDELHFRGWKAIADQKQIEFTSQDNERLRGVSRMESLEILLENSDCLYSEKEKQEMAEVKNQIYGQLLNELTPYDILPGAMESLTWLKHHGYLIAIGSSSKNTPKILKQVGLDHIFDAVADGNQIVKSKPDPEVFLLAATLLGIEPSECLVVEDAYAGIEAAKSCGMMALGVGAAKSCPKADYRAETLKQVCWEEMGDCCGKEDKSVPEEERVPDLY